MYSITKDKANVDVVAYKNDMNQKMQEQVKNLPNLFGFVDKLGVLNRFSKPDYITKL